MSSKDVGGTVQGGCSDLEHPRDCATIHDDDVISPEEDEALRKLAEIFIDDMIRLEREYGLTPEQMADYYEGKLDLEQLKGQVP